MRRATGARAPIPTLPDAPAEYNAGWASSLVLSLRQAFTDVIHGTTIKPIIQVEAFRNADQLDMTVTVKDPDRRVKAIEFNKREGANWPTGWVDTWDYPTGTIGTDAELIRTEEISIPPGMDSAAEWRVKWRDQQGTEHIEGGPIPLANLASVNKTIRIPYSQMVPISDVEPFNIAAGYLDPNSLATTRTFYCSIVVPRGVEISGLTARIYRATGSDAATVDLWQGSDTTGLDTKLASADHTGTGWATVTDTFTPVIGNEIYQIVVQLFSLTNIVDSRFLWAEIAYAAPNYAATI